MHDQSLPRYLDAKTFADEIGFHRETLYRRLKSGDIPGAKKIGGCWRIPRWALKEVGTPAHLASA
jgi:predicted DNA-binding transcriptional regulator AlpA